MSDPNSFRNMDVESVIPLVMPILNALLSHQKFSEHHSTREWAIDESIRLAKIAHGKILGDIYKS